MCLGLGVNVIDHKKCQQWIKRTCLIQKQLLFSYAESVSCFLLTKIDGFMTPKWPHQKTLEMPPSSSHLHTKPENMGLGPRTLVRAAISHMLPVHMGYVPGPGPHNAVQLK